MSLEYVERHTDGLRARKSHPISRLISSYMEPESCSDAVRESFWIVELLLLSNHLDHANALAHALYKHMPTILPADSSKPSSAALQYFWFTHPDYPRPDNAPPQPRLGDGTPEARKAQERWQHSQWQSYRECTRTGWMLEHCNLPEPQDPHVWRDTDDAAMIAMCARLLAKDKTPDQYPPMEQLSEALDAARKLYAQPQVPITEWTAEYKGNQTIRRHSYLVYRRLATELAIRTGQLDVAADVLSQGLLLDGFVSRDGASLDRFLELAGIYDVLPLLAAKGKTGSPYYIEEDEAKELVEVISQTLERRAVHGRDWSLAPDKVGWRELLDRLAIAAWALNSKEYEKNGIMSAADILNEPASEEEIRAAEESIGELPADLKEMFRIADGFQGGHHFLEGGLGSCTEIEFYEDGQQMDDVIYENDLTCPDDVDRDGPDNIIMLAPGAECDDIEHYIITPTLYRKLAQGRDDYKEGEYRFWYTSHWHCGNEWFKSVREFVAVKLEQLESRVADGDIEEDWDDEDEL